ncbi:hypothetical protein BHE74_00043799 [Ensete ventricosum]|nr:hypothetical protein BHE74_00043799 [Ensete ventricosum]
MARHALAPYCCNRTSTVRFGHAPRDDKGKVGRTNKLPSHRYKTPISATGSSAPRRTEGQTNRHPKRRSPRRLQPTSKALIPTDVGELAYSDENRSSRHLSSTPESSITFLTLEGGPMSQERPTSNPNSEHPGGSTHVLPSTLQSVCQAPRFLAEEASTVLPTPNRYWRLFNDPRLTPPDPGLTPPPPSLGPPVVTTEAFLGLAQQVRTLTGMIQAIVPYIPQLVQAPMHQRPDVPRQMLQQEAPRSRPTRGEHPGSGALHHPPIKAMIENLNASVSQPTNHSRDVMRTPLEPDVVSSDSTNSVREQLCQVNQRLDEVSRSKCKQGV